MAIELLSDGTIRADTVDEMLTLLDKRPELRQPRAVTSPTPAIENKSEVSTPTPNAVNKNTRQMKNPNLLCQFLTVINDAGSNGLTGKEIMAQLGIKEWGVMGGLYFGVRGLAKRIGCKPEDIYTKPKTGPIYKRGPRIQDALGYLNGQFVLES